MDATGCEFSEVKIKWLKNFESRFNPNLANDNRDTVKRYILDLLQNSSKKPRSTWSRQIE